MNRKRKAHYHQEPMASTSAAPSKGDELIKESIELINKMKQQSAYRNGMNVHDRNVTPEQIVQLFIETNDKIDKCIDFEIHEWLTKYESFKEEPNFHQAALLIINAAQIYGRKVDYLEEIVLHMDSDRQKQMEKEGTKSTPNKPRRSRKRYRPDTDALAQAEYNLKDLKPATAQKLTETLCIRSMKNKNFLEKHKYLSQKYGGKGKCKTKMRLTSRIAAGKDSTSGMNTYTSFGNKVYIYDYEMEEIIGSRSDFKVYTNIIHDETSKLINDYDFTQYFEHVDYVDEAIENEERQRDELKQKGLPIPPRKNHSGPRKIKLYLSRSYLKQQYDISLYDEEDSDCSPSDFNQGDDGASIADPDITEFQDLTKTMSVVPEPAREVMSPPAHEVDKTVVDDTDKAAESVVGRTTIDTSPEASSIAMEQLANLNSRSAVESDAVHEDKSLLENLAVEETVAAPEDEIQQTNSASASQATVENEGEVTFTAPEDETGLANLTSTTDAEQSVVTTEGETILNVTQERTIIEDSDLTEESVVVENSTEAMDDIAGNACVEPSSAIPELVVPKTEEPDIPADKSINADIMPPPPDDSDTALDAEVCQINEGDANQRISVDEGISIDNQSTPVIISELNETEWAKLTPKLELTDILHPINKYMDLSTENLTFTGEGGGGSLNFLGIDEVYLTQREHFQLPLNMLVQEPILKHNILQLPESRLKRKANFMLPVELMPPKKEIAKFSKATQDRIARLLLHQPVPGVLTPPTTPTMDDGEDFLGFDIERPLFDETPLMSSTMIENPMLSLVQDTDLLKPSTPSRTLSRDSGITSPTPQEREKEAQAEAEDVETKVEDEYPELLPLFDDHQGDDEEIVYCVTPDLPEDVPVVPVETSQAPATPSKPTETVEATPSVDDSEERDEPLVKQLSERDAILAKAAQDKYQQQVSDMNDLVRKVNQWHAHLKPILKQSEQRNHFDIHEYGSEIIDAFPAEFTEERLRYQRPSLTFATLMRNKGKDYTARFFLSTLQLVNANNIKLTAATRDPRKITPIAEIHLQLLSRVRHHQEMDNISDNLEKAVPLRPNKKTLAKRKRTNAAPVNQFTTEETAATVEKRPKCLTTSPAEDLEFMKKLRQQFPTAYSDEAIKRRIVFRRNLRRLANDDGFVEDGDDYLSCEDGYAGDVSATNTPDTPKEAAKEALLVNRPSTSKVMQWQQKIAHSFSTSKPNDAGSVADSGYLSTTMTDTSILSDSNLQLNSIMLGGGKVTAPRFSGVKPISYPSSDEGIQMLVNGKRPLEEDRNNPRNPSKFMKT